MMSREGQGLLARNMSGRLQSIFDRLGRFGPHHPRSEIANPQLNHLELPALYSKLIRPGELCFDVGAHLGNNTEAFLRIGARVISIEPQQLCIRKLEERFRGSEKVVIVPMGVAEREGVMFLSICETASTISTFSEKWKTGRFKDYKWESRAQVEMTTLDALINQFGRPAFCKIDVEGFEYEVIKGLSSRIPAISFEFAKEFIADAERCMDYLVSLGMREFNLTRGETPKLELPEWTDIETALGYLADDHDSMFWGNVYARSPLRQ